MQGGSSVDGVNVQGESFSQGAHLLLTRQDNLTRLLPLFQVMYLEQLLTCVDVLLHQCDSDCGSVSLQVLQVLITVQSLSTEPHLIEKVKKTCMNEHKHENAMPDISSLQFCHHFAPREQTSIILQFLP